MSFVLQWGRFCGDGGETVLGVRQDNGGLHQWLLREH